MRAAWHSIREVRPSHSHRDGGYIVIARTPPTRGTSIARCIGGFSILRIRVARSVMVMTIAGLSVQTSSQPDDKSSRDPVLVRVVFLGLGEEEEASIRQLLDLRIGDPMTQGQLNSVRMRLKSAELELPEPKLGIRQIGGIASSRIDPELTPPLGVELVLDFRPPPKIFEIRIVNLSPVEPEPIRAACRIHIGDTYDPAAISGSAVAIRDAVQRLGFEGIRVTPVQDMLDDEKVVVSFFVEGSAPPVLHDVRFEGLRILDRFRLRRQLRQLEPSAFDEGTTVTASLLQAVIIASNSYLQSRGYLEGRTYLRDVELSAKGLNVAYEVDRGPRYRMGDAYARGIVHPEPDYWAPIAEPILHGAFTSEKVERLHNAYERQAQSEGYMAPEVKLGVQSSPDDQAVDIVAFIDEGTKSRLGKIVLERAPMDVESWYFTRFAPPVKEDLVRKQVRARLGDLLELSILDDAERRLWALGAFSNVSVETLETDDPLTRDLRIRVVDRATASLGFDLGWHDEVGAIGGISLTERNLGGRADRLRAGIYSSDDGLEGELSYLDRYWKQGERWFGTEREPALEGSVYSRIRDFDEYDEEIVGGRLGLGYLIGEPGGPWSNSWRLNLEHVSYDPDDSEDDYEEDFDSYVASILRYRIGYDLRERGQWGYTGGWGFNSSLEIGAADDFLLKWTTQGEWYRRINSRWLWSTHATLGLMASDATDVGLAHRFHAGGGTDIRGFDYRGVGPVDDENDDLHIGGATKLFLRNEIQYSLFDSVRIPFFLDIGTLDEDPLGFGELRASLGTGVRFTIPGLNQPAYLYFAQSIIDEDTDDERSIHFGFGFTF